MFSSHALHMLGTTELLFIQHFYFGNACLSVGQSVFLSVLSGYPFVPVFVPVSVFVSVSVSLCVYMF